MVFSIGKIRAGWPTAGLFLLLVAPAAFAAPGFVTGANVTRDAGVAEISVQFACGIEYVSHLPVLHGDRLRVQIESTGVCAGASPTLAYTRGQYRPLNADLAKLVEIDYDGNSPSGLALTLAFSEVVRYQILHEGAGNRLTVKVQIPESAAAVPAARSNAVSTRVPKAPEPQPDYVINLSSSRTPHTASDRTIDTAAPGLDVFESEVVLAGVTWYRLRLGHFKNTNEAEAQLAKLQSTHPTAWIDLYTRSDDNPNLTGIDSDEQTAYEPIAALASVGLDQVDKLMADARRAMVAGEVSRAVQIYTKVLRIPNHDRHAEAHEYLGLAREKNGQSAHARAEYQRYLALYPDDEGASRVSQRLAALMVSGKKTAKTVSTDQAPAVNQARSPASDWRTQVFLSQYYRRDANQLNDQDEIVSQSAIYTDINLDARRRGQRFDFSSRLSAGYRSDLLKEETGSGDELRVSYAYADLADSETGLRGRIGRQSRNSGGVLGRFDGLNLSYRATERILVNAVAGEPVTSRSSGGSERIFYGTSITYGPLIENLELGMFFVQQEIDGVEDRQAVGTEFRYFGENQSLWGLVDYDTSFNELSSAFLQGNWRIASRLTISGSVDQRHTPFLSTGSALIGQPVRTFEELRVLYTAEEIRQLSLDRAPLSSSYTAGVSYSISPKLQITADANQTTIDGTPESGGVFETPESTYTYFSSNLVASSLFKEGDVMMIGLRFSDSDSTKVTAMNLDVRFPIGNRWRINPRLRVDQRQIMADSSDEWIYTPGLRVQYRHSRKFRVQFEAGKRYSQRDLVGTDLDRESYFLNVGYQAFF